MRDQLQKFHFKNTGFDSGFILINFFFKNGFQTKNKSKLNMKRKYDKECIPTS